eukprot:scaffold870_cov268-Pinguiococcus_pyrenoidosus.AAC.6
MRRLSCCLCLGLPLRRRWADRQTNAARSIFRADEEKVDSPAKERSRGRRAEHRGLWRVKGIWQWRDIRSLRLRSHDPEWTGAVPGSSLRRRRSPDSKRRESKACTGRKRRRTTCAARDLHDDIFHQCVPEAVVGL